MNTLRLACLFVALLSPLTGAAEATPLSAPVPYVGLLEGHNRLRTSLQLPQLKWSTRAAQQAQAWADQLAAEGCPLRYNPDEQRREQFGENIFKAWSQQPYSGFRRTAAEVAQRWQADGQHYDHATHTCHAGDRQQCGQYLQMIWETTEELGCGRARCETAEIWVCNYSPRGGQEGLKPYGNPPPAAEPELIVGALECRIQVGAGVDLDADAR